MGLIRQPTVLLVDSTLETLSADAQAFRKYGLKTLKASSGEEAMDILHWLHAPLLAVIDIILPDMSGLQLAAHIKEQNSIPLIITGYQRDPLFVSGLLDFVADDFLHRPYSSRELAARGYRLLNPPQSNPVWRNRVGSKYSMGIGAAISATKLVH